ncbi:putative regulator of chromosome condensation domain-containing protein [Neospora caninum Liverpool]|nr:putative regulator of chromosome condensation domain-containing protein [Neospora caninum Liverpool]CBZ54371.1 putative regulator of chromosome condensation domain-containing protein [Neospora caninum Liverpool]|eukprot:XP_003884401.1 putative regulator of chromosome condensation domain-containing protein [Neospora caninum Liverpool]
MNRLIEIRPEDKGILVSQSKLIVVNGGACDFYTISLAERVETPVVISIRATFGEVAVSPDTLQIKPEEYDKPRRIVVVGGKNREVSDTPEEDSSKIELLHYVTSKTPAYDGFAFRLTVVLVSTSGAILRSFGSNLHFQLAHDSTNKKSQTHPQKLAGLPAKTTVPQISSGARHTCAVLQDGTLFGWGDGSDGQLALPLPSLGSARTLDALPGDAHTDGTPSRSGDSLVRGPPSLKPARVHSLVASPESGRRGTLSSQRRGRTLGPGGAPGSPRGRAGATGLVLVPVPRIISALEGEFVVQVGCGEAHTLILTLQGTMYAFGNAQNGRLGIPRPVDALDSPSGDQGRASLLRFRERGGLYAKYSVPQLITGIPKVRVISVGAAFSACIDDRDCLYTWGSNTAGQLGLGHTDDVWQPQKVETLKTPLLQASCGKNHLLVLTYDGHVFATGEGGEGRLGLGDTHSRHSFERVKGLPPVRFICAGGSHSAALDSGLLVWTWGSNCCGQLGLANWQPSAAFLAASVAAEAAHVVKSQSGTKAGAAREAPTLTRAENAARGVLSVWGKGKRGGDEGVSAREHRNRRTHTGKRTDGEPKQANNGHEGDEQGTREARKAILTAYSLSEGHESLSVKPQVVEFLRDKSVVTLALGPLYSLAVTLRGFVYAWGSHEQGQLGLSDRLDNQPLPVLVPAFLFSPAVQVFASPCSNCSFVSSVADVLNPFLSVSVSNSPLGSPRTPSAPATPTSVAPTAFRSASERSTSSGRHEGAAADFRAACAFRSLGSAPRRRSQSDSSSGESQAAVRGGGRPASFRLRNSGKDAQRTEKPEQRAVPSARESQRHWEGASTPRPRWQSGHVASPAERRKGEEASDVFSFNGERRRGRRSPRGDARQSKAPGRSLPRRLARRRGAVKTEESLEMDEKNCVSAVAPQSPCARCSRPSSRRSGERGKRTEARKSRFGRGQEDNEMYSDEEEEFGVSDGPGQEEKRSERGRRQAEAKRRPKRDEEAAAASQRIAENRRVGHASCTGGSLNPKNAQFNFGDQFGSWYRKLEEQEEEARQAADLCYRLRRGEERMEMFKKAASRRERSSKQSPQGKAPPVVDRMQSAPKEAAPEETPDA